MTKYPTIKRLISFVLALTMVLSLVPANGLHVHAHEAEETVIAETSPAVPTETPTEKSTEAPTEEPTEIPTEEPTQAPTEMPTQQPTEAPTEAPVEKPLIVENKVVAKSAAKASSPSYIASIGIAQDGSSGNTGINDCKNQLAGHTIIDCDLNKGCGATSDYIYMGYMTTTDPSQAITGILLREGKNPPHSITYRDYTFNLVGGLYESNTADLGGLKDLNGGAGGAYIYMYVTRSPGYGPALTALTVTESTSAPSGYVNVTDNNGSLLDMNKGAYLYLHARKYSATVNVTFNYVDENGRHSATSTKQLNNHLDVLQGAKTVPAAFTYSDIYWELIGWRDDNTAGPREYGNMDIVVGPDSTNKVYNAVYHSNNGGLVSYDANGGTGNMTAGDFSEYCYGQYMNAGTSSIQYAMAPYKLKTFPDMTYPGKCAFLGWSLDKNATTPTYADGETVTFPSNLTLLYAVWKDHSNEKLNLTNNGDTHTYFRSCCLKAVTENHYDNNRDGLCDLCGGSTDQPAQSSGVYQITNKAELIWFMQHVNRGNKGANAKVVNNIDMGGYNWTPIAQTDLYYKTTSYADKGYTGTFDGNNKVISNFKITASTTVEQTYGLFGTVSGTVRNLGVTGVSYTFPTGTKDLRAGGIVGQMLPGSRVENSYVAHSTITPGQYIVGGIAACNYGGAIENCYTYKVSVSGHARCGNLVSDTRGDISSSDRPGTVKNCYTDATRMAGTQSGGKLIGCAENVSAARFASGEIACKLGAAWGQTIGTDALPVLGGAKVYEVKKCDGETT